MLSVATSIDALAVGLTLAMLEVGIWYASAIIGVVTASCRCWPSGSGLVSAALGTRMEVVGGLVLIAIGVRILVEHLW